VAALSPPPPHCEPLEAAGTSRSCSGGLGRACLVGRYGQTAASAKSGPSTIKGPLASGAKS